MALQFGVTAGELANRLCQLAQENDAASLRTLLGQGATVAVDWQGEKGRPPLVVACENGCLAAAKVLVDYGADVNGRDKSGATPLMAALWLGQDDMVQWLQGLAQPRIDYCAEDCEGKTALHWSLRLSMEPQIVQSIMKADSRAVLLADCTGATSLHIAAQEGLQCHVGPLLDLGAAINAQDMDGNTSLHLAVAANHVSVARALLQRGANMEVADCCGDRPIHTAASHGLRAMCQTLLEGGADANSVTEQGNTALDLANENGHTAVGKLLEATNGRPGSARVVSEQERAELRKARLARNKPRPPKAFSAHKADPVFPLAAVVGMVATALLAMCLMYISGQ